ETGAARRATHPGAARPPRSGSWSSRAPLRDLPSAGWSGCGGPASSCRSLAGLVNRRKTFRYLAERKRADPATLVERDAIDPVREQLAGNWGWTLLDQRREVGGQLQQPRLLRR